MKEDEKAFWNTFLNQKVGNITEEYEYYCRELLGNWKYAVKQASGLAGIGCVLGGI